MNTIMGSTRSFMFFLKSKAAKKNDTNVMDDLLDEVFEDKPMEDINETLVIFGEPMAKLKASMLVQAMMEEARPGHHQRPSDRPEVQSKRVGLGIDLLWLSGTFEEGSGPITNAELLSNAS